MELSQQFQKEAKKMGVSAQYVIMCDLKLAGYSDADAYAIAYPENATLNSQQNRSVMQQILQSEKFKKLTEQRIERHGAVMDVMNSQELINKEDTARMILASAMAQSVNSKERIEGLMKYSDLMGYKKDEVEENSTDAVQFFLPLKCNQCPLFYAYNDYLKQHGEHEIRPVEMEHIIDVAHTLITAAEEAE